MTTKSKARNIKSQSVTAEEIAQFTPKREGRPKRKFYGGAPRTYRGYPMFYAEAQTGLTVLEEDWANAEPGNPKNCAGVCANRRVNHVPEDIEIVIYPSRAKLPIPFPGSPKGWVYLEYAPSPETKEILKSWDKGNPQMEQHLLFVPLSPSGRHDTRRVTGFSTPKKAKKKGKRTRRASTPRGGYYDDRHAMPVK